MAKLLGSGPRARNLQVEIYQSGDVDYLVFTDAIGMGLNMDIKQISFSNLKNLMEKLDDFEQQKYLKLLVVLVDIKKTVLLE